MIYLPQYNKANVYVLGLGKTGRTVAQAMQASGANVFVWDDNAAVRESLAAEFSVIEPARVNWLEIKVLVASPGIPFIYPVPHVAFTLAKAHEVPIISDIELLMKAQNKATFIGITGTNGKSTTTALLTHILKKAKLAVEMGGNIGTPALSLEALGEGGCYVLESSSFQLELLAENKFNIALLLNISEDHANRYASFADYVSTKASIFNGEVENAIISIDYPELQEIYHALQAAGRAQVTAISTCQKIPGSICIQHGVLYDWLEKNNSLPKCYTIPENESLLGIHNQENIAAAYAAARACGVHAECVIAALANFKGLEHRMEIVHKRKNICYINDSKATNSNSTAQALKTFDNIYWIAGGLSKDDGFVELMQYRHKIIHVYLVGEAQEKFAQILAQHDVPFTCAGDLATAMQVIKCALDHHAVNDLKTVLLSPACASWDQWPDYIARGNAFIKFSLEHGA